MTFDGNDDLTAAHEALWDAIEDGDAARLAALFVAVPGLRDVVDSWHPRSAFTEAPLHFAARMGYDDVCAVLIDNAAVLDRREGSETPLALAARQGKLKVARLLLDRGADPDGRLRDPAGEGEDFDGNPSRLGPLHFATQCGDERMVGLLLERGATCDLPDADGNTALHHSTWINAFEAARLLITAGADERRKNHRGEALADSIYDEYGVVRPTDEGNAEDPRWTPSSIISGHVELMHLLDQVRGDTSYSSASPIAAFMEGASIWQSNVCKTSPWARDVWDSLPWADRLEAVRFCARLLWKTSPWHDLQWEVASWSARLWDELTARDTPAVLSLLRANPRLSRARHPSGATALHLGVYDADLTRELLRLGADVSAKDASGDTALHSAARLSAEASVRLLIAAGAAVGARNRTGVIPYDIAHGYRDEVDFSLWIDGTWSWASETPPGILFSEGGLAVAPDDLHLTGLNVSKQCPECHDFGVYTVYAGEGVQWVCDNPTCDYREPFDDDGTRTSLPTFGAAATPTRGSCQGAA